MFSAAAVCSEKCPKTYTLRTGRVGGPYVTVSEWQLDVEPHP